MSKTEPHHADEHAPVQAADDGFSKKFDSHIHALSLYFVFYNFARQHKTLRMSPAMAAGIINRLWSMEDVVALIDAREAPYKKKLTA